jgi:hypothetical protein
MLSPCREEEYEIDLELAEERGLFGSPSDRSDASGDTLPPIVTPRNAPERFFVLTQYHHRASSCFQTNKYYCYSIKIAQQEVVWFCQIIMFTSKTPRPNIWVLAGTFFFSAQHKFE